MIDDRYDRALEVLSEMADEALMDTSAPLAGIYVGRRDALRDAFEAVAAIGEPLRKAFYYRYTVDCAHVPPGSRCYLCQPD